MQSLLWSYSGSLLLLFHWKIATIIILTITLLLCNISIFPYNQSLALFILLCVAASDVKSRLGSKIKQQTGASKLTFSTSSQPESKTTSGVFSRLGKKSAVSWYLLWLWSQVVHLRQYDTSVRQCSHSVCFLTWCQWHPCCLLALTAF